MFHSTKCARGETKRALCIQPSRKPRPTKKSSPTGQAQSATRRDRLIACHAFTVRELSGTSST